MGKNKHIEWVDYAKGIGIILVVYGHVARGVLNAGLAVDSEFVMLIDRLIYSFHMPLFFFLSGMFFIGSLGKRDTSSFIINKLHTLIYPYLLWSIIQLSMQIGLDSYTNFEKTFENIYSFFWQPSDHFWFLYTLFVMFVVYALVYYMTSSVTFLLVLSLFTYLFQETISTPWVVMNSVYQFGAYFGLGIALSQYKNIVIPKSILWAVITFVSFVITLGLFEYNYPVSDIALLAVAVVSIILIVIVSKLLTYFDIGWLKQLGSYSLEIYLVHIIFGSGFRIIMQHAFGVESGLFHLFFGTLVGLAFSILFVEVVKKLGWGFLFVSPKRVSGGLVK
jgi:fucose 4-O-acetylase-like acetyltransferase